MSMNWLQIRGDPSIRRFLFDQQRAPTLFDQHLDEVLAQAEVLLRDHGIFHAKIHFSSGQVTLWLLSDPLRYRVHLGETFLDPHACLAYPRVPYSEQAIVPPTAIARVFNEFRHLRTMDEHVYLCAGSLNLVNGMVGLNFSCDGSHYLHYADLLAHAVDLRVA